MKDISNVRIKDIEIFNNTKKFCKYWWKVYSPINIEYCDYEQECAVVFYEKLSNHNEAEAIALAQLAYKWKLLAMMQKNDITRISSFPLDMISKEEKYFSLNDMSLTEIEKRICEGLICGYSYKELSATKRQIMSIRKKVGDYFEISQKNRSHNTKYSKETCNKRKEIYLRQKDKLLKAAIEAHKRPVIALKDGITIFKFDSLKEATLGVGLKSSGSIRKSIKGLCKAKGYNWQYAE